MKKGCFIQIIIFLTILTAAVVYIIKNHFQDVVLEPGKKIFTDMMMDEFDKKYMYVADTPEKDSLKLILNDLLLNKINKDKNLSFENFEEFFDSIEFVFNDSLVDKSEISYIKKITGSEK